MSALPPRPISVRTIFFQDYKAKHKGEEYTITDMNKAYREARDTGKLDKQKEVFEKEMQAFSAARKKWLEANPTPIKIGAPEIIKLIHDYDADFDVSLDVAGLIGKYVGGLCGIALDSVDKGTKIEDLAKFFMTSAKLKPFAESFKNLYEPWKKNRDLKIKKKEELREKYKKCKQEENNPFITPIKNKH